MEIELVTDEATDGECWSTRQKVISLMFVILLEMFLCRCCHQRAGRRRSSRFLNL